MKNAIFSILILLISFSAKAQNQTPPLDQLNPGYQPTVLHSFDEAVKLFDEMPLGFKMGGLGDLGRTSQCYQRAELWSYNFHRNYQVNAMKVFVFYTHTYKQAYYSMHGKKFEWWFHVAPYLLVRNASTQAIEEFAVDATFADKPLPMKAWTDLFIETHRKCAEFIPFEMFRREVQNGNDSIYGKEHCYIIRTPATEYDPTDIEEREAGQKTGYNYGRDELEQAVTYAPSGKMRGWWRAQLGL